MAGERSLVNLMADTGIGGSTIKNEWKKAQAKGIIPKTEKLVLTGLRKATEQRSQGSQVQRFSGEPFPDTIDEIPPNVQSESKVSGGKDGNPEKAGGGQEKPDLSGISKQISTSMKSMELQLRNGLGTFEARLKEVERAKSGDVKTAKSPTTTKASTIDLRQGGQEPPPETTDVTADPGDENEVGDDDDDNKEPPEGQSRVIFPDGTPDGKGGYG